MDPRPSRFRLALCFGILLLASACGQKPAPPARGPTPEEADLNAALEFQKRGAFGAAADRLADSLAKHPDSPLSDQLLFWLGFARAQDNHSAEAIQAFQRLLAKHPKSRFADLALLKAYSLHRDGRLPQDLDNAQRDLEELIARFPGSPLVAEARWGLAGIHEEKGNLDKAREQYGLLSDMKAEDLSETAGQRQKWLAQWKPADAEPLALFLRGFRRRSRALREAAIQDFQAFSQKFPRHPLAAESLFLTALCQAETLKWKQALETFQEFLKRYPQSNLAKQARENEARLQRWLATATKSN